MLRLETDPVPWPLRDPNGMRAPGPQLAAYERASAAPRAQEATVP